MGKSQPQRGTWDMTFWTGNTQDRQHRKQASSCQGLGKRTMACGCRAGTESHLGEKDRRWCTTLYMLGLLLKKVNFTLHGFLSQKITLENMTGAIGNIQFSFLQRFIFILIIHVCAQLSVAPSEARSVRCSGEVGVRDDQASHLHQQCAISPVPLPIFYVLNVTKRLSTKLMFQVNRKFL